MGDVKGLFVYLEGMGVDQQTALKGYFVSSYEDRLMEDKYAVATINKKIQFPTGV